jgi:hypothetical protein
MLMPGVGFDVVPTDCLAADLGTVESTACSVGNRPVNSTGMLAAGEESSRHRRGTARTFMMNAMRIVRFALLLVSVNGLLLPSTASPAAKGAPEAERANYPLELVSPRAAGTSPSDEKGTPNIPAGHRIFRAYPGIEYNIRAVVIGGSYPYRFDLSDAPRGMTIHPRTGEIRWASPAGERVTPTVTVTDAEGDRRVSSWTITVTADGFRFVDAVRGSDDQPGTLEKPWKSLARIKSAGAAGEVVYFRQGTYRTTGMQTGGGDTWTRVEFNGRVHPVQWLAYPGEQAVIDNDYSKTDRGRFIRLSGSDASPVYLDGLEITNSWHIGLQFGSGSCDYAVFRRLSIHDIAEGIDGANSAGIMTLTSPADPSWYSAFQDNDFHHNAPGGIKQYSQRKLLWEDCRFRDSGDGPDLKSDVFRFEVRGCAFYNNRQSYAGLFGNMHPARGGQVTGEVRFNRMLCGDSPTVLAMDVNQDGLAGAIHLYRNTFVGTVRVRNTDGEDGPFYFSRNVIVNSNAGKDRITLEQVSDVARVRYADNLTGTPGDRIVDGEGNLTEAYKSYRGSRGHQIP